MNLYRPIELGQPGKPACPDQYSVASTVECQGCGKATVQTSLAGVYIQFGTGQPGAIEWGTEEPYLPVTASLVRQFDAVRVRNMIAGQAAQVLITPIPASA